MAKDKPFLSDIVSGEVHVETPNGTVDTYGDKTCDSSTDTKGNWPVPASYRQKNWWNDNPQGGKDD